MKKLIYTLLFIVITYSTFGESIEQLIGQRKENCLATREYVTALEFLREKKNNFLLPPKQAQKVSSTVSKGCTGAAGRFIKVTSLLSAADLDSNNAISIAKRFALSTDSETAAFITIFKKVYLKKYLDLSVQKAVQIALSLSIDFQGKKKHVLDDFHRLVKFCVSEKGLDLPKPKCAGMAVQITRLGQGFDSGVSVAFIELYNYLTETGGLALATYKALEISQKAIVHGPLSKTNFIQAYKYAIAKKGLDSTKLQAVNFAVSMAARSSRVVEDQNAYVKRAPAAK